VKKILLCDSDSVMLRVMQTYLSWYGFATNGVGDSAVVEEHLLKSSYDLFICDHLSKPVNAYGLCERIRQSAQPGIRNIKILMVAPGNVEAEDYKFLRRMNINFMSKFNSPEKWFEKINSIIKSGVQESVPAAA